MGSPGLHQARQKMLDAGVDAVAVDTFAHYYRLLEHGETGLIPESSIEPLGMESLAGVEVDEETAADAIRTTAVSGRRLRAVSSWSRRASFCAELVTGVTW